MTQADMPGDDLTDALVQEARRLAGSGRHTTWQEVEDALRESGSREEDLRLLMERNPALREEIESLAQAAHGVGGPASS